MYFLEYGNVLVWFLMGVMMSVNANYLAESWAMFTSDRPAQPKCMDIPQNFTLCKDIQVSKRFFENLLESGKSILKRKSRHYKIQKIRLEIMINLS
jgi:hypothetical protein